MKNFVQSMFQSSPVMLIMKDDISTRDVFVFVENNPASLSGCEERRMRGWHFAKGKSLRDFHGRILTLVGFVEKRGTGKKYEAEKYISSCIFFPSKFWYWHPCTETGHDGFRHIDLVHLHQMCFQ